MSAHLHCQKRASRRSGCVTSFGVHISCSKTYQHKVTCLCQVFLYGVWAIVFDIVYVFIFSLWCRKEAISYSWSRFDPLRGITWADLLHLFLTGSSHPLTFGFCRLAAAPRQVLLDTLLLGLVPWCREAGFSRVTLGVKIQFVPLFLAWLTLSR